MPFPITAPLTITVVQEEEEKEGKDKPKPPHPKPNEKKPNKSIPPYKLLTKDGRDVAGEATEKWSGDFNDFDGGKAEDLGDGEIIYKINYDNAYHLNYRKSKRNEVEKDTLTKKYILGMQLLMLGFEHALRSTSKTGEVVPFEDYKDDFRRLAAKGAAATVLSLAEVLPKIIGMSVDDGE